MHVDFVAPAFGFQKNTPYPDNAALRSLIEKQWTVCRAFDASIGFHSGSGKSAENYQVMGEVTGGRLEIKTSGRYTYEMGAALASFEESGGRGAVARLVSVYARDGAGGGIQQRRDRAEDGADVHHDVNRSRRCL